MKTFLTICTCAMVAAGIYGFTDMVVDVKNGTMIQYDHGDGEEPVDVSTAAAMIKEKKPKAKVHVSSDAQVIKKESTVITKAKSKKKIAKKNKPVVKNENPVQQEVVVEEAKTDVKVDSVPQIIKLEAREFDYSDFSRGAPRKYKKSKKSKKD